jgi:RNA polymerase sigma-70 factor (TIGR02960 family)
MPMYESGDAAVELLARARAGDPDAFADLAGHMRRELQLHCYRILGSAADAEDMLQETMMAAWRGIDRFEGRSSLRSWLYKIATNKCLNHLRDVHNEVPPPRVTLPEPTRSGAPLWLEPYPEPLLDAPAEPGAVPEGRIEMRESVSLAFVAALQHLPPRQRAALVLRDVLGFRSAETAGMLECSPDAANSLLKRARATMNERMPDAGRDQAPLPESPREREASSRFADAFERGDVPAILALLTDDAWLTMPPLPFDYQGHDAIDHFLRTVTFHTGQPTRLIPTRANGQPAFARYIKDPHVSLGHAQGLIVLTLRQDRISAITGFMDNSVLPRFGLPRTLRI